MNGYRLLAAACILASLLLSAVVVIRYNSSPFIAYVSRHVRQDNTSVLLEQRDAVARQLNQLQVPIV